MKGADEPHAMREHIADSVVRKPVLLRNGNSQGNPNNAPRCGAKTRRGTRCVAPAMPNGRCRMHGGKSTGPRTTEGLNRSRKANRKHGLYSAEAITMRKHIRQLIRESRSTLREIEELGKASIRDS
jgi:hypothetical protein